ncbi:Stage V sporulation protein AF [Caldibacillus thermoamylovorans]|uniref:Stage V sporulation protein AF n=1 Tax=Caldibacillus thermoamylovorans TaxID=35841 RepID=A0A090KTH7_9BACI|nr:spore germination protein [Caldibacillus thermoamylovorans]MCM3477274.1 spore germination protein [Caldibacillus thermoamylovorans]CEE02029.1 Stage V sporulation protein AF [Caldibacillus thermoamylovorans]
METNNEKITVSKNIHENINNLRQILGIGKSFDVIQLDLLYAERDMAVFFIDGFIKDDVFVQIMKLLSGLKAEEISDHPLEKLLRSYIPYVEIETTDDLQKVADMVLAGPTALIVDGIDKAILIDARTYPARSPEEPDIERVVRGSRDGYVETLVFNTALTRRRIRDRTLRMEYMQVGRRSKTDVVVCYLEDIADEDLVIDIKKSLEKIDTDGIPMAEKTVEEFISGNHWNPYPTVRYTERPDTAAAHLYEGHVCIIVDGSPSVIIAPTTFWHHLQHAEEYRNKPVVGAYLRLVRFLAVWASIFLLPLWYLLAVQPELLPERLSFIGPNEDGQIPLYLQFLLIEVGIDMLRMAAIHTPNSLATALGLVAALMIGQVAVEVGLFSNEVILYLSIAAIGMFATPSYEMSLANRIFRLILLTLTAILHEIGFVIGTFLWVLLLVTMKSYNVPYLWPFIPFDFKGMMDIIIRAPIPLKRTRPKFLDPKDPDR